MFLNPDGNTVCGPLVRSCKACFNKGLLNRTGVQRWSGYHADCESPGERALVALKWDVANSMSFSRK